MTRTEWANSYRRNGTIQTQSWRWFRSTEGFFQILHIINFKASYDCLLSLVETMSRKGKDMGIILNECISGLSDPSQEIKVQFICNTL